MFNIDETPIFTALVKITAPGGEEQSLKAAFEALDIDVYASFDLATPAGSKAFLERVFIAVDDVVDAKGNPVSDSQALRDRIINKAWCRSALVTAYLEGHNPAREGN